MLSLQLTIGTQGLWYAAADYIVAGRECCPSLRLNKPMLTTSTVYVNSFLASLNSRNKIRRRMAGVVNVDTQLVSSASSSSSTEPSQPSHTDQDSEGSSVAKKTNGVKVNVDTAQQNDDGNPYDRVNIRNFLCVASTHCVSCTAGVNGPRCSQPPSSLSVLRYRYSMNHMY